MLRISILGLVLSIALIVVAFIIVLGTDVAIETLQPIFCGENETLLRETYSSGPNSTEVKYYCTNSDRTDFEDVTGLIVVVLCATFIPMTLFILLVVRGATRRVKQMTMPGVSIVMGQSSGKPLISGISSTSNYDVVQFPGQKLRREEQDRAKLRNQLDQLKTMHDAGKISYQEYERIRKRIMDELVK